MTLSWRFAGGNGDRLLHRMPVPDRFDPEPLQSQTALRPMRPKGGLMAFLDHEHQWGPIERAWFSGNPHRKCQLDGCTVISLDLYDDEEEEEEG